MTLSLPPTKGMCCQRTLGPLMVALVAWLARCLCGLSPSAAGRALRQGLGALLRGSLSSFLIRPASQSSISIWTQSAYFTLQVTPVLLYFVAHVAPALAVEAVERFPLAPVFL